MHKHISFQKQKPGKKSGIITDITVNDAQGMVSNIPENSKQCLQHMQMKLS